MSTRKFLDKHSEAVCIKECNGLTLGKRYRYYDTERTGRLIDIQNDFGIFVSIPVSFFRIDTSSRSLWSFYE